MLIEQFSQEWIMLLSNLEYGIRKRQYAIDQLRKDPSTAGLGSADAKRGLILQYAYEIVKYKQELFQRTGRCSPTGAKWPLQS
tara:strand:+ start:72 stop:320 length:249 start_codon:yes stop_codon:yes gene_type:complete